MKPRVRGGAFSVVEVLVICAVLTILALLLAPMLARRSQPAQRIKCISNLKNIGLSFRIYATDNEDQFPAVPFLTNQTALRELTAAKYFTLVSNELSTPMLLYCSKDTRRKPARSFTTLKNANVSYFANLSADERTWQVWLAGDRNLIVNAKAATSGLLPVATNDFVGWSSELHNDQGHICMSDGSVQQASSSRLQRTLKESGETGVSTNLLLIP